MCVCVCCVFAGKFINPCVNIGSQQALMTVNDRLRELYPDSEELFDIVLMTNNHAQVGVRLINSINHYGMCSSLSATRYTYARCYFTFDVCAH